MKSVSGDKVSEEQALVKYSSSEAQAGHDSASRAVAKADRHQRTQSHEMKPLQLPVTSASRRRTVQPKLQLQSQKFSVIY